MFTNSLTMGFDEPPASAERIFQTIRRELQAVETEFERQARSNIQVIAYLGDYLRKSGGKRVRPALTILAAYACGGDGARHNVVRMAAVMEFLHTATLVHDDIIDNAELRRNRASINARFGNQAAVLMGDWLYMSAFETSLAERSLPILDILTLVTRKMTEGELLQLTLLGRVDVDEGSYFDVLRRKTAYLFSACCEIGAILATGKDEYLCALRDYGLNLGIAFQLIDDALDLTASERVLGKPAGADLLEGKVTLPLIDLLKHDPSFRSPVQQVMREGNYASIRRESLLDVVESSGSLRRTRQIARDYAETARRALEVLPHSVHREVLESIPGYIISRDN